MTVGDDDYDLRRILPVHPNRSGWNGIVYEKMWMRGETLDTAPMHNCMDGFLQICNQWSTGDIHQYTHPSFINVQVRGLFEACGMFHRENLKEYTRFKGWMQVLEGFCCVLVYTKNQN